MQCIPLLEQLRDMKVPLFDRREHVRRVQISIRVDEDVLEYFKSRGPGHLARMNDVLRWYVDQAKQQEADEAAAAEQAAKDKPKR